MQKSRTAVAILTITAAGLAGTRLFEGKENRAYVERVAGNRVVTVCYGHTRTAVLGQTYTDAACDALLLKDMNDIYAPVVRKLVKVPLSQGEFNALVDFVYNVGEPNFRGSTLLALVNAKQYDRAALEFARWKFVNNRDCTIPANKCGGIPKRRAWERQMFESY